MRVCWDIETYPNCFTLAAEDCESPIRWAFEISAHRDDSRPIVEWVQWLIGHGAQMVGFNNVGFDYPVLHALLQMGRATPQMLYDKAMSIIHAQDSNRFASIVFPSDRYIEQIDLFKIHHFDNKARSTSLKALEFNMRMDNISDLPFPVGAILTQDQIAVLKDYNAHDVTATKQFYLKSIEQIDFRTALSKKHNRGFMNHSDVKIGKEIFQMELEKAGVQCYKYGPNGREPMQSPRSSIALKDCIPEFIRFENPEFQRVKDYLTQQVIVDTKGALKVEARVGGLEFAVGTGGLHASVSGKVYEADADYMILDIDVTSLYPSIAIGQKYYPEHLGAQFVSTYRTLRTQRIGYKKGSAENAMLKLALNGVYGASGDKFSIFYDPLFTMRITIGGQMMVLMLAEWLLSVGLEIIQANTDGITLYLPRVQLSNVRQICAEWEKLTDLSLEYVEYSKMAIRDVNNYLAVSTDGKVKRKGAYEHDLEWHQNTSALVIAKVAEQVMVYGKPIRETVVNWPDRMDFMLRVKVPRSSQLWWGDTQVQNTCRYYVSTGGKALTKVMPPLAKNPEKWRSIGVESGWTVCVCNDLRDAMLPINYDYYINEVEKLCLSLH